MGTLRERRGRSQTGRMGTMGTMGTPDADTDPDREKSTGWLDDDGEEIVF